MCHLLIIPIAIRAEKYIVAAAITIQHAASSARSFLVFSFSISVNFCFETTCFSRMGSLHHLVFKDQLLNACKVIEVLASDPGKADCRFVP